MRAIKVTAPGKAELVSDAPTPRLRSGYMLARPKAWAINPTDHHHIAGLSGPGATIGVNYSGVVLEVGPDVTQFQPGDEVLGGCHGGNNDEPEDGAFGEVVAAKESATLHKPAAMSWEEAATLMTPIYTVGQCLVHVMGLNEENGKGKDVLVYGGSSATGSVAIQVLKQ